MGVQLEMTGTDALHRQIRNASRRISEATAKHIYEVEIVPLARAIQQAGQRRGGPAKLAANTVGTQKLPGGGSVVAPARDGVGASVFYGSEFGGRRRAKVDYTTKSRRGRSYQISRRTTMQFDEWTGKRGYWFFPTVREVLKGLRGRVGKVAAKAVTSANG